MDDVEQLKALRSFMIRQARIATVGTIELGQLNLLRFSERGRFPEASEWSHLEYISNELYRHLPEQERRRFLYGQIPQVVIRTATMLGGVALASLVLAVASVISIRAFYQPIPEGVPPAVDLLVFLSFLGWVAALGGIGSIAFIGMNALAVQDDATFDITNEKLIGLRVILGALFGVVMPLPFVFPAFIDFVHNSNPNVQLAQNALLLFLPFILGFSTTLVIMILNQCVEAIQSFFGKKSSPPSAAPPIAPPPVPQVRADRPQT